MGIHVSLQCYGVPMYCESQRDPCVVVEASQVFCGKWTDNVGDTEKNTVNHLFSQKKKKKKAT